jgi:hypothetical protein
VPPLYLHDMHDVYKFLKICISVQINSVDRLLHKMFYQTHNYLSGVHFASFYDFSIRFWNCSDNVVFFVFHLSHYNKYNFKNLSFFPFRKSVLIIIKVDVGRYFFSSYLMYFPVLILI